MDIAAPSALALRGRAAVTHVDRDRVGPWALGFAPVLYLALRGGGYDLVVRSEAGLAAWWIAALGVCCGVLPLKRIGTAGWLMLALVATFAIWTTIGLSWSSSAERTLAETGRLSTYLAFFALALLIVHRGNSEALLNGLAAAFGVVALLAVLSRLSPHAFPVNQGASYFPVWTGRLAYPLNYPNGTAEFIAVGIPLLLAVVSRARTLVGQAVAGSMIPVAALAVVMCASRGGIIGAVVGACAFLVLAPQRIERIIHSLAPAAGSAILIAAFVHRSAFRNAIAGSAIGPERHQMALLLVLVCVGVALVSAAVALIFRFGVRRSRLRVGRRKSLIATFTVAAGGVIVALAVGLPATLSHQWDVFKQINAAGTADVLSRIDTAAGSHRYQYWQAAVHAYQSKPPTGIGPGTYEFYWVQHGATHEFVRNAHSLYLETLAETGPVGLVLLLALLLGVLAIGVGRTLRAPTRTRQTLAGACACMFTFCVVAAFDWIWQLTVLPVAALLVATILLRRDDPVVRTQSLRRVSPWVPRSGVGIVAVLGMLVIMVPLASTEAIRASQAAARAGDLSRALADAEGAQSVEPFAATPRLQRALILEQLGRLPEARIAIAQAETREPLNWRIWLISARIAAEDGRPREAVAEMIMARSLAPSAIAALVNG